MFTIPVGRSIKQPTTAHVLDGKIATGPTTFHLDGGRLVAVPDATGNLISNPSSYGPVADLDTQARPRCPGWVHPLDALRFWIQQLRQPLRHLHVLTPGVAEARSPSCSRRTPHTPAPRIGAHDPREHGGAARLVGQSQDSGIAQQRPPAGSGHAADRQCHAGDDPHRALGSSAWARARVAPRPAPSP